MKSPPSPPYTIEEANEYDGNETDPASKQKPPRRPPRQPCRRTGRMGAERMGGLVAEPIGVAAAIHSSQKPIDGYAPGIDGYGAMGGKQARRWAIG